MGDWWYYVATMTFRDIAARVQNLPHVLSQETQNQQAQKSLSAKRVTEIMAYLRQEPQRFLNAIVVGLSGGNPDWLPLELGPNPVLAHVELDNRTSTAFGIVRLSGRESIFVIDGRHRVEAIRRSMEEAAQGLNLAGEEQAVILVAHKGTKLGRERTRRLFKAMRRYCD